MTYPLIVRGHFATYMWHGNVTGPGLLRLTSQVQWCGNVAVAWESNWTHLVDLYQVGLVACKCGCGIGLVAWEHSTA